MIFWFSVALMTAVATLAVAFPLFRKNRTVRSGSDVAVYRDQLDEVERDLAAGLIGKTEAEAARIEISRRLLAAADDEVAPTLSNILAGLWRRRAVMFVSLILLPLGAGSLYVRLGSPSLAFESSRSVATDPHIETLVSKIEAHLRGNPNDGRGWEVLAPVYMQLGRYSESVNAWRNVLRLLGDGADREADLGEALMAEANGVITAEAKDAFARAVTLDSTTVSARFYLGVAAEQDGDREKAARIWRDLIADAPVGAHWVSDVRTALTRVESIAANEAAGPLPGPKPAEMVAAAKVQPSGHDAETVNAMIERLAARLNKSSDDPEGWIMLTRSYLTTGQTDKANAAIADARHALGSDQANLEVFNNALARFKIAAADATPAAQASTLPQAPIKNNEMIRGMVARLADRLKQDGSDFDGWMQLVRSYIVLGERDRAKNAAADARHAIGDDIEKRRRFDEFVKGLGLDG